jgi:hypothetical protein
MTPARDSRSRKFTAAGKAPDGVVILMPAVRPKNFTYREIERTVDLVKGRNQAARAASGRFPTAGSADGDGPKFAKRK